MCRGPGLVNSSPPCDIGRRSKTRFLPVTGEGDVGKVAVERLAGEDEAAVDGRTLGAV